MTKASLLKKYYSKTSITSISLAFAVTNTALPENFQSALIGTVAEVNLVKMRNTGATLANTGYPLFLNRSNTNNAEILKWINTDSQKWNLERIGGDTYRIRLNDTNLFIRASSGDINSPGGNGWGNYDNVELIPWNGWNSQKWYIDHIGNGMCNISQANGYHLMANTGGDGWGDGDNVFIHSGDEFGTPFKWDIEVLEYVGSPSIVQSPDGQLIVYYKKKNDGAPSTGHIATSTSGANWTHRKTLPPYYGPSLFTHDNDKDASSREEVYMLLVQDKDLKIISGSDNGSNWTEIKLLTVAKDYSGVPLTKDLESGGGTPVLITATHLYYAFMDNEGAGQVWPGQKRIRVASCPIDQDITLGSNWTVSSAKSFPSSPAASGTRGGWLEANLVELAGEIMLFARVDALNGETIAAMRLGNSRQNIISDNQLITQPGGGTLGTGFINAPIGGSNKFHIVQEGSKYWIMCNTHRGVPINTGPHYLGPLDPDQRVYDRNELALYSTTNFQTFTLESILLQDDMISDPQDSVNMTGFQQPSFIIDGSKIKYVSRTAYGTFDNYHDANMITYHEYTK